MKVIINKILQLKENLRKKQFWFMCHSLNQQFKAIHKFWKPILLTLQKMISPIVFLIIFRQEINKIFPKMIIKWFSQPILCPNKSYLIINHKNIYNKIHIFQKHWIRSRPWRHLKTFCFQTLKLETRYLKYLINIIWYNINHKMKILLTIDRSGHDLLNKHHSWKIP